MSISKGIVVCRSHIVNISNDGVYTMSDGCGVDFIFRYCNAEMATVEGVPVEEMLNRSFYKVFPNGDKKWLDPPAVFDSNKSEILLSTENKLKEIYEAFPNEGKVVLGYSYLVSWNYVTWLDFPRPIDEELIPLFKKWIRKFPENKLELMEYYSFILFEKWLYMDSLDNISEANKIYYEIKAIADELSKDYADNQVTQMLSMGIVRKL